MIDPRPALSERTVTCTTPCGDGHLVWRRWPAAGGAVLRTPVVLVHGGAGSWTHWVRTIPALIADDRDVWAVDLPGLGDSAMPPQPLIPATCGRILADGVAALFEPPRRPHLVAFSWGAHVSTLAAVRLQRRIASLTIVGSSAIGLASANLPPFPKQRTGMTDADIAAVHRTTLAMLMIRDRNRIDDLAIAIQADNVARTRFRSREFAASSAIAEALAEVAVPVTGIWGARDVLAVPSISAVHPALTRFRRPWQPPVGWRQIEDAGHWVMYEQPDAFNRELIGVLAGVE